jgi:hypothetical protein
MAIGYQNGGNVEDLTQTQPSYLDMLQANLGSLGHHLWAVPQERFGAMPTPTTPWAQSAQDYINKQVPEWYKPMLSKFGVYDPPEQFQQNGAPQGGPPPHGLA